MERDNNNNKENSGFFGKLGPYSPYIIGGAVGLAIFAGYNIAGYSYDVKTQNDEELEKDYPNVMKLWHANSFWAKMERSKFENVMRTPIEFYVTKELIPRLYHNSVTQNVKEFMSKTGYMAQDQSIIGQILNELSNTTSIQVEPPESLTNRIFQLFVPDEDGFITKDEFVTKFYWLTKPETYQTQILEVIFKMLDVEQKGHLSFNSFFELFNEVAQMVSEFTPRLLLQIRKQIRDVIIEKIYDKFDQYIPVQDIPEEKFTIITAEFSHKNTFSLDVKTIFIPPSLEKIQEVFKDQSRVKQINDTKQRVLDIQDFRNCVGKIFNYPAIAEKIINFALGQLSESSEDSLFNIDKETLEIYKSDCIEEIKNNSDRISDILWDLINSNGDEYLNENEFDTFFSFLYSMHEVVEDKVEDENPMQSLNKSYKGIFLAKESGSDFSNAHRISRMLKNRHGQISGQKLQRFINSLLSFFTSFLDALAKSVTTKSSIEKHVASWIQKTFEVQDPKTIEIKFDLFKEKLGDTICTSISKFISKLK